MHTLPHLRDTDHRLDQRIPGCAQSVGLDAVLEEILPGEPMAAEPWPYAREAVARVAQVLDRHARHFLPPFFLIGSTLRSPAQTTFGPVISTVPKTTGIGRPSSAVGSEKSSRPAACGFSTLGRGLSA